VCANLLLAYCEKRLNFSITNLSLVYMISALKCMFDVSVRTFKILVFGSALLKVISFTNLIIKSQILFTS